MFSFNASGPSHTQTERESERDRERKRETELDICDEIEMILFEKERESDLKTTTPLLAMSREEINLLQPVALPKRFKSLILTRVLPPFNIPRDIFNKLLD